MADKCSLTHKIQGRVPLKLKRQFVQMAARLDVSQSDLLRAFLTTADPKNVETWCDENIRPPRQRRSPTKDDGDGQGSII